MYLAGTVVAINISPAVQHLGLISDRYSQGKPMVISSSLRSGEVKEEPMDIFTQGRKIQILGYPGRLPPKTVLARARSQLRQKWDLFTWNCEHLVSWAHGFKPSSPQVKKAVIKVSIISFAWLLIAKILK